MRAGTASGSAALAARRIVCAAVLAAALVAAPRALAAGGPPAPEDGAVAPDGCWTTEGGCPARTASAATFPLLKKPAKAWEWSPKGELEGEPLVWGPIVYAATNERGLRTLTALALETGKPIARKSWRTDVPLLPNVWNGIVVVRSGPQRIEAVRARSGAFQYVSAIDAGAPVCDVILFGREIYARVGDRVNRYHLGRSEPVWRSEGRFRGRLALRGGHVYAVQYPDDDAVLVTLSRDDGALTGRCRLGHHDGKTPDAHASRPRVQAFERDVFVHHELGVPVKGGGTVNLSLADRHRAKDGSAYLLESRLFDAAGEAAGVPSGWIGAMLGESKAPELWLTTGEDGRHWTLATAAGDAALARPAAPPSVAGGVAFVGGAAIDLEAKEVLWRLGSQPQRRAVPARDSLIVITPTGRVEALREPRPADAPAALLRALPASGTAGRAVLRDGTVVAGTFRPLDPESLSVEGGQPPRVPLADVLVAEDANGALFAAAREDEAADGVEALALRESAAAYAALAIQAIQARDAALLERLIAEATTRGAEPKDVVRAESQLKAYLARPVQPKPEERAKVLAAEAQVAAAPAHFFWERALRMPPDAPKALTIEFLARALDADPHHAEAAAAVRALLPAGIAPPEPFDPRDWISFVRAAQFTPLEMVKPPQPGAEDLTPGQRMLGMYLGVWRKDLIALQSRQLLVISAPVKPGRIANCISAGELVCDLLESAFSSGKHVRTDRWPMTIVLFEDRDEYLKVLGRTAATSEERRMLEWSVGQYARGEGSRLYLPEDEAGFRRVLKTFVHELTHQWLAERCPLYSEAEAVVIGSARPGHFVVEGFAEMVEEMSFDLRRRTWRFDPGAPSLETVAALPDKVLFPWKEFFAFDQRAFGQLSHETDIELTLRRTLGGVSKLSRGHVYYDQAAAVCHYLFQAEGGKRRQALLEFAAAYYAGRPPAVFEAFGMTAEELGAKVVAFAREHAAD